jgi:hypothetical protein
MSEMITAEDHGDVAVLRLAHGIVAAKIRHSRPMLVRERPVVVAVCGSSGRQEQRDQHPEAQHDALTAES